jgi:hypothetical protein
MTCTKSSDTNGDDTINIDLNKDESSDDVEEMTTTSYIISQNEKIASEIKVLMIEKNSLENVISEKNNELERTNIYNLHLKEVLKNFKELSRLHNKIAVSHELMMKESQSDINNFLEEVKQIIHICAIGYIVYISLIFFAMSWSSFIIANITIIPFMTSLIYISSFKASSNKVFLIEIHNNKNNIKKIEESLDS